MVFVFFFSFPKKIKTLECWWKGGMVCLLNDERKEMKNEWKRKCQQQNSSYIGPTGWDKEGKEGRQDQIYECVHLVRAVIFMERTRECFKNKEPRSSPKIRLDHFWTLCFDDYNTHSHKWKEFWEGMSERPNVQAFTSNILMSVRWNTACATGGNIFGMKVAWAHIWIRELGLIYFITVQADMSIINIYKVLGSESQVRSFLKRLY